MKNTSILLLVAALIISACSKQKQRTIRAAQICDSISVRDQNFKPIEGKRKIKILSRWLAKTEKEPATEDFTLISEKDNEISFPQGTKIKIKANTLVDAETGKPIKGKAKLQVKEYYLLADFIKNKLTTTCNDTLLETGGTIFIEASAKGRKLALKEGETMEISFPTNNYKEGMMLFEGKKNNNIINWELNPLYSDTFYINKKAQSTESSPASFPEGNKAMENFINSHSSYPKGGYQNASEGPVFVRFIVHRDGHLSNITLVKKKNPILDSAAINVVKKFPAFKPAIFNRKACSYSITVPIRFYIWYNKYHPQYYTEELKCKYLIGKEDPDYIPVTDDDSVKVKPREYTLVSRRFGWINCDRFANQNSITQKIHTNASSVQVVFNKLKSIAYANKDAKGDFYINAPYGEPITIIALRNNNDRLQVAKTEASISMNPIKNFKYWNTTIEELNKTFGNWN